MDKEILKMKLDDYETYIKSECKSREVSQGINNVLIFLLVILGVVIVITGLDNFMWIVGIVIINTVSIYHGRFEVILSTQKELYEYELEIETAREMIDETSEVNYNNETIKLNRVIESPKIYVGKAYDNKGVRHENLYFEYNNKHYPINTDYDNYDDMESNERNIYQEVEIRVNDAIDSVTLTSKIAV